jgi:hypothetical protein
LLHDKKLKSKVSLGTDTSSILGKNQHISRLIFSPGADFIIKKTPKTLHFPRKSANFSGCASVISESDFSIPGLIWAKIHTIPLNFNTFPAQFPLPEPILSQKDTKNVVFPAKIREFQHFFTSSQSPIFQSPSSSWSKIQIPLKKIHPPSQSQIYDFSSSISAPRADFHTKNTPKTFHFPRKSAIFSILLTSSQSTNSISIGWSKIQIPLKKIHPPSHSQIYHFSSSISAPRADFRTKKSPKTLYSPRKPANFSIIKPHLKVKIFNLHRMEQDSNTPEKNPPTLAQPNLPLS